MPTAYINLGIDRYPSEEEIVDAARKACERGYEIAATYKAAELGNPQMANVVMLGALSKVDDFFDRNGVRSLVERLSPANLLEDNLQSFDAGFELA